MKTKTTFNDFINHIKLHTYNEIFDELVTWGIILIIGNLLLIISILIKLTTGNFIYGLNNTALGFIFASFIVIIVIIRQFIIKKRTIELLSKMKGGEKK